MHFVDFAICSSWIEYRRDQIALGTPKKDILDCLNFRIKYEEYLAHGNVEVSSSDDEDPDFEPIGLVPQIKRPRSRVPQPPDSLRRKHALHLPDFPVPVTKNRCRFPGCKANKARVMCSTCKVFLCLQDNRNCFKLYHEL